MTGVEDDTRCGHGRSGAHSSLTGRVWVEFGTFLVVGSVHVRPNGRGGLREGGGEQRRGAGAEGRGLARSYEPTYEPDTNASSSSHARLAGVSFHLERAAQLWSRTALKASL